MTSVTFDACAGLPNCDSIGVWVRALLTAFHWAMPFRLLSVLSQHSLNGKHTPRVSKCPWGYATPG